MVESKNMPEEREMRLLSQVDVLEALSEEELRELSRQCPGRRLDTGQDFYRREIHDSGLFLILEGRVRVYTLTPTGEQTTLDLIDGGTVLWARWLATVHGMEVHAQAVERSVVAFMRREDLAHFVRNKPETALKMIDLLAEQLGSASERMTEIAQKEVRSRLASQILRHLDSEGVVERNGGYRLPTAYTHEELGMMIGAKRVAITRAFTVLQDEGVVELKQRRIHVPDIEALQRIADQER
jgi:CRP/FNR family transcriptional regulator